VSAVVGWLRVANATVTGAGVSSLPDVLGGTAAAQGTDANRPPLGASGNGLPILQFAGTQWLDHAVQSGVNNNAAFFGIAMWLRTPLSAAGRSMYAIRSAAGGASAHRVIWQVLAGEDLLVDVSLDNSNARRLRTATSQVGNNIWSFCSLQIQCSLLADARTIMTQNATVYTTTYSAVGTAPEMPATLVTPTGDALIGMGTEALATPFTGDMGPNLYFLNRQLTAGDLANLRAFEQPVD
jgi:hypothetical protein